MIDPDPALAPVMPPVIVPSAQVKLPGTEAVNAILGLTPLHIVAVVGVVTTGTGLTVTVIIKEGPAHEPVVEVGVTIYSIVPDTALLRLTND
jgi:hypothetical protein